MKVVNKSTVINTQVKEKEVDTYINSLKNAYGQTKVHKEDYFKFIDIFITKVESIVGKDYNVGNQNIFLRYDAYYITHDHNGYPLDKPIIIIDKDNKIIFKNNHPFFKVDVYSYTNHKLDIDVYYNAYNKLLLGYKEKNKEYQFAKRENVHIIVNYSIISMIKLFGYSSRVIKISDKMKMYDDDNKTVALEYVIDDLIKERIMILKKILTDLQKYIYRFANNYYEIKIVMNQKNIFY